MSIITQTAAPLCILACLFVPSLQKRVKQKDAADFPRLVEAATKSFEEKKFGACIGQLNDALTLAIGERTLAIQAALPKAPAGWLAKEPNKAGDLRANPMAAAFSAGVGTIVQHGYTQEGGRGRIDVTVTADSPMVKMIGMALSNPALLGADAELIEYGKHKAILKQEGGGSRLNLQIVLFEAHICEVKATELNEDGLFAMFDQSAVDALARALSE